MEAPRLPSLFRNVRSRPKGFNFTPRYYDPEKEDFEQRMRRIESELRTELTDEERDVEAVKSRVRQGFKSKANRNSLVDKGRSKRLLIILGLLLALGRALYRLMEF